MGAFIVFEGIDGTGKSTVCAGAEGILRSEGYDVMVTAEPTHEGIGAFIRSGSAGRISQDAESLLFVADRVEHTRSIEAAVSSGKVVLCDRYYASTIAYQSAKLDGDSADGDMLVALNGRFIDKPDAVILLDADPRLALGRVGSRGEAESKFESLRFLEQVRSCYLELARKHGYHIVDASRSEDEVLGEVMGIIREVV